MRQEKTATPRRGQAKLAHCNERIPLLSSKTWLLICFAHLGLMPSVMVAQAISGNVFRDFNANGTKDNSATYNEIGVGGITVNCTDSAGGTGTTTTSTATATLGNYSLTGCTGATRVEFTWTLAGDYSGAVGTGSNTSVQFVNATRTSINFGINYPQHYTSETNPEYVVSQFEANRPPSSQPLATAMLKTRYNARGTAYGSNTTSIAHAAEIGATWGLAYDRPRNLLYASSFVKRHASMVDNDSDGKEDIGAIYSITPTGSPTLWADLSDLGIDFGLSLMPSVATRALPNTLTGPSHDASLFPLIGKIGIGDIDISDNYADLYVMNLYDQKIYTIDIPSKTLKTTSAVVPSPCSGAVGNSRPFGLKYHRGKLYVGAVCDATVSNLTNDLVAKVYSYDGATFNTVLTVPLNYTKGYVFKDIDDNNGNGQQEEWGKNWNPWSDTMPAPLFTSSLTSPQSQVILMPQPMLVNIEFDADESMILVFNDRFGHQAGQVNYGVNTANTTTFYTALAGGDILRASYASNVYTLENSGIVGGLTGNASNNNGPGGGEFYHGDHDLYNYHAENIIGGSLIYHGKGEVAAVVTDPIEYWTGGVYFFDNINGDVTNTDRYQLYQSTLDNTKFGKANGLGDMELMSSPAPIEIGNRVWLDTDNDGIQDAGEAGISGVQVQLIKGGTTISTATTDANGNYYFSSATGTDTASIKYGLTQLEPNMAYTVRFPTTTTVAGTTYNLTTAAAGSNRLIDSNAPANGDVTILATDIPVSGANNHSFDVGYSTTPPGSLQITKTVTGAPGGFVSPNFSIVVDCSDNAFDQTLSLANGGSQTITGIPAGTTCTVTEPTQPAAPVGYVYGTPMITPSGAQAITAGGVVTITVTNPLNSASCPVITVTPNPLTNGTVGTIYSANPSASASSGGPYTYTWSATGLPTGLGINSGSGSITGTPSATGSATITASTTVAGQTCTGTTMLTVSPAAPVCATITNVATIQSLNEIDSDLSDNEDSVDVSANCTIFDLALDKKLATGQSSTVAIGDLVNFEITVYNQGSVTATGIQITDYVDTTKFDAFSVTDNPSGTTTGSVTLPYSWSAGGVATITGSLTANQNLKLPVKLRIKAGATGTATNTAEISAATGGTDIDSTPDGVNGNTSGEQAPNLEDNQIGENGTGGNDEDDHDPASVTVAATCAINTPTVTPTCNDNGTSSDPSDDTFTFTISATGSNTGANYKVDKISPAPTATVFASLNYGTTSAASPSYPISGGNLTLTLTDNTTTTCSLTPVTVTAPPTCSSVVPTADLELTKTSSSPVVRPGDSLTYTLTLVNKGPGTANGVVVRDVIPAGLTFVSATTATGSYSNATGLWTVGNIAPGTYTLTINVTVN